MVGLLLLILLGSAVGWMMRPMAPPPIRLGLALNLSGHGGTAGEYIREGALLAVEEVNAAGGIHGRPLELLVRDDRNTEQGVIESDKALLRQGVVAIIGHVTSQATLVAYPLVTTSGVLLFTPYTATHELTGLDDLFLRTSMDTAQYGVAMAKLLRRKQTESVAFVMDMSNPSFALEYVEYTRHNFTGHTRQFRFDPERGIDWRTLLGQLLEFNPDAVVFLTEVGVTGIAAQKLVQSGYTGPMIATLWAQTPDLMRFGGTAVEGMSLVTFIDPDNRTPAFRRFSENMQRRLNKPANARSTRAYEAINILAEALRHCNRPTAAGLKQQLLQRPYPTLLGKVEFDANGDVLRKVYEVRVENGRFNRVATL
jgi:branched-chain amino acid transport system substrate-binding protein